MPKRSFLLAEHCATKPSAFPSSRARAPVSCGMRGLMFSLVLSASAGGATGWSLQHSVEFLHGGFASICLHKLQEDSRKPPLIAHLMSHLFYCFMTFSSTRTASH